MNIQGTISDVKAKYRKNEYAIETERGVDISEMLSRFPKMRMVDGRAVFAEDMHPVSEVLRFISERAMPILKIERLEPTLEDLFREVADK